MTALDERPTTRSDWRELAACQGMDTEEFFPSSGERRKADAAIAVCRNCPVWPECRDEAVALGADTYGVWGGTTEADRRRARKPTVEAGRVHGGPRARVADSVRADAVARFHELRADYPTDTRCATVVGAEIGTSATAVVDWVRAARKAVQAEKAAGAP